MTFDAWLTLAVLAATLALLVSERMAPVAMAMGKMRTTAALLVIISVRAFLTPIGYQTNTMVYGPGGYRFGDYARLGAPLTLVVVVVLMVMAAM